MSAPETISRPVEASHQTAKPKSGGMLRVSAYDQVASAILSALLFVATAVGCLFLLYFSQKIFVHQAAVPVKMAEVASGPEGGSSFGTGKELDEPGTGEAPADLVTEAPQTLESISTAVSSRASMLDAPALATEFVSSPGKGKGDGRGKGRGKGTGEGDGTGTEKVPRAQRWVMNFEGNNLKTYAKQLEFFGIELAVLGGEDNLVHYAFHLSQAKPDQRTGPPEADQRLYMSWRSGPLQQADRDLLTKAGIPLNGRVALQFYPKAVEDTLAQLEKVHTGNRDINEVRRTTFGVRAKADGYEFFVVSQTLF